MPVSSESTSGEKTRCVRAGAVFCKAPAWVMVACTNLGWTNVPPLATALYASRTCSALTASTCPIGNDT